MLDRILCRQFRRAASEAPGRTVHFTEMLPGPEDCWLTHEEGRRYTSELRIVAADLQRRAASRAADGCS